MKRPVSNVSMIAFTISVAMILNVCSCSRNSVEGTWSNSIWIGVKCNDIYKSPQNANSIIVRFSAVFPPSLEGVNISITIPANGTIHSVVDQKNDLYYLRIFDNESFDKNAEGDFIIPVNKIITVKKSEPVK